MKTKNLSAQPAIFIFLLSTILQAVRKCQWPWLIISICTGGNVKYKTNERKCLQVKTAPRIKAGPHLAQQQALGKKNKTRKNAQDIRMLEDRKVEEQENILLGLHFASRREEKIRCQLQKPHQEQDWASARRLSTPGSCVGSRPDYVYAAKERPQSLSAISLRLFYCGGGGSSALAHPGSIAAFAPAPDNRHTKEVKQASLISWLINRSYVQQSTERMEERQLTSFWTAVWRCWRSKKRKILVCCSSRR